MERQRPVKQAKAKNSKSHSMEQNDEWSGRVDPKKCRQTKKIEAAKFGFYRRLLKKLSVNRELYAAVVKRKKGFFGYTTRIRCPLSRDII